MSESDPVVSVSLGPQPYATLIHARSHMLAADEPGDLGGNDTGPTPYELLLASVGSCKAITAKMYAQRKGWALESVRVELRHERPEGRGGPERIGASFVFEGDLDDEQRERLLQIAEKCPVQKTITGGLSVESTLVDAGGGSDGDESDDEDSDENGSGQKSSDEDESGDEDSDENGSESSKG